MRRWREGAVDLVGEEPHQNEDRYADAIFDIAELLQARRVVAVGGVYGAMPYDRDREISCVFSLPRMRAEMAKYAVRFSSYEGGTTIGTYLAHWAEYREMEMVVLNAFVPAYEFPQGGLSSQGMRVEQDWKSWYDVMRRIDYMFGLGMDLSELRTRSQELITALDAKVAELVDKNPDMNVREYLAEVARDFEEMPFIPLDDVWNELGDVLGNMDE
jgi:proteasome assembly chaperone (PAC2) family protein